MVSEIVRTATAAFAMLAVAPTIASAQNASPKNLAVFTGECRLRILEGFFPCDPKVAYVQLSNGRSLLSFTKDGNVFSVSGGHDRQPNPQNYYLSIDTFRLARPKLPEAADTAMEGECHFVLNADATVFYSVKCDVYDRAKGSMYNLYLENISHTDHEKL
jgi:hypothetical protein